MGPRTSSPGTQTLPAATDLCPAQARAKCCIASTILRTSCRSPRYCLCCQIALHLLLEGWWHHLRQIHKELLAGVGTKRPRASTVAGVCQAKHHSELQLHEASCKCPRCCVWWYYLHRAHAQKGTIAKHIQQPGAYDQPRVLKECAVRIESNNLAKVGRCTNGSRMKTGVSASVNRCLLATAPARCYAHEY